MRSLHSALSSRQTGVQRDELRSSAPACFAKMAPDLQPPVLGHELGPHLHHSSFSSLPNREMLHRRHTWLKQLELLFNLDPPAATRELQPVVEDSRVRCSLQRPARQIRLQCGLRSKPSGSASLLAGSCLWVGQAQPQHARLIRHPLLPKLRVWGFARQMIQPCKHTLLLTGPTRAT